MKQLQNGLYYVGVNDRNKQLFEGLWPLPNGVSYNSYLIDDQKTCLIDTVEVDFFTQFLENIREVIGDRPIDYVVVNHMEPDHSGSLSLLKKYYPDVQFVGNKKTFGMMQGFYGIEGSALEVKDGDTLDLGTRRLRFFLTPMVHWPETMMTYEETTQTLFSGDAFGCFGALNGGILDREISCDDYWMEMIRYYSNIVGKYGTPVQNALKKLSSTPISLVCSTHGPVWQEHTGRVVEFYDRLSRYETAPGLVICYATMYGNTERMAEAVAEGASQAGLKNIVIYNVSQTHHSYILRDIFRFRGLIVGAPTYNTGLYHQMEVLLSEVAGRDIKNHLIGWFGSHGWASKACCKIEEWNETRLHFETIGTPVDMKQAMNPDIRQACQQLGREMAEKLLQK